ncbi:MAG: hypothetical protein ABF709_04935 [Leuconostoc pseudomesenteroides]|uniref:hypothetical protein n=1 Tax=Leuconostoc pseudomesenteroides TaxID=33968 RepID=UPI001E42511A|nr:hypothetical protein [Leuconostoc pseudomesenteroides]MCC7668937.1 hypothetical protein [Leuconostoc pseudomesenteroides]
MSRYTVKQDFKDRLTGVIYHKGDDYPAEGVSDERLEELLGDQHKNHAGALIITVTEKLTDEVPTIKSTVAEIKAYLNEKGVDTDGVTKKQDLLDLV